ncbi:SDR family NAD(P)-dependent oxidoreductase [Haloarcula salinisoli]|uniref:SDR family NAD(P)-dependent oxidoreductase n=1 Tax=Haloarcula salinisoli TaxID=2487746 RepID=A0A8J7YIS1_9EURY|nr:SDR family NAD(P)-dependent oxidoreductase [Halomicroarcula salinisoli]MBX0285875.1 SDR family NAD(P)-dependent oxidoreductase [Halomicroarcula salinisoli]MBX0302631.1 SDR family NAD(P)-dependent oxidoreductase [Halomicroarcula salinisoli]
MARTAVIAGVGPGLGASLARKFVAEGCQVGLFARSTEFVDELAAELGEDALAVPTDITDQAAVTAGFEAVREQFGSVDILVNHASGGSWDGIRELSSEQFEHALDVSAVGAFRCSQAAIEDMLAGEGDGTIIFTGATSAVRGRGGAPGFSAGKFAARGLAESMARELGPEGIHVAHVVIDGGIDTQGRGDEDLLDPDAIADAYWTLVEQDRSAWTLELDLRPHVEAF